MPFPSVSPFHTLRQRRVGIGEVCLGEDRPLDRKVGLKVTIKVAQSGKERYEATEAGLTLIVKESKYSLPAPFESVPV